MSRERIVIAKFANGNTFERGSLSKVYTHAYRATVTRPDGQSWNKIGFSCSPEQCGKNAESETAYHRRCGSHVHIEVVPVTEIEKRGRAA